MGAPMGNRNAAGKRGGVRTIKRTWSTGTTLHTFKRPKKRSLSYFKHAKTVRGLAEIRAIMQRSNKPKY